MKRKTNSKAFIGFIGLTAILALTLVTASLGSLEFKQGTDPTVVLGDAQTIAAGRPLVPYDLLILIPLGVLVLLSVLALFVIPPKQRRKILFSVASAIIFFFIASSIIDMIQAAQGIPETTLTPTVAPLPEEVMGTPIPAITPAVFHEPQVDAHFSYFVALAITAALALGIWLFAIRRRAAPMPTLEEIARQTIVEIRSGADWGRSVEGAYLRMVAAVQDRRGLSRRKDITPAEFAVILGTVGLPADAVHRLTALFERVRYGGRHSSAQEIDEAVACLTEIMDACQEVKA